MKPSDNEIEMLAAGFAIQHKNGLIRFAHALLDKYAPQASAEDVRNAALEEAAASINEIDDGVAPEYRVCQEHIRALKQPQADKDGAEQALKDLVTHGMSIQRVAPADFLADRQQHAGDVDVGRLLTAAKGMTKLYGHVWDRADGALVVFPENVARFDAAFDALRAAVGEVVDDATQPEQGERDEG